MKVMQNSQIADLTSVRKQIGELSSDLQAFERRQAAKPLDQDELFLELSTGKNSRPWAPNLRPLGHELSQDELLSQLQAQAGSGANPDHQAAPVDRPHSDQPAGLSQESLLEALKAEAKGNV